MPKYVRFFDAVIKQHYPEKYSTIRDQTYTNYSDIAKDTAFARHSANPIDKRLDFCSYFLALIKTLDNEHESFERIRMVCLQVVTEYVKPKNALHRYLKRIPPKIIGTRLGQVFIKAFHKRVSVNSNPKGFVANIITDRNETYGLGYGIDIMECGICKLYNRHGFGKYAPILCEVDELTSGMAGLKLMRTGTIANGAKKCDFRFKRL